MDENANETQLLSRSSVPESTIAAIEVTPLTDETFNTDEETNSQNPFDKQWNTTIVSQMCRDGNFSILRAFVEYSRQTTMCGKNAAEIVDRLDADTGLAPLHHAARYQQLNHCIILLSNIKFELGVNIKDEDGRTPIHAAFRSANDAIMKSDATIELSDFGKQIQNEETWQQTLVPKILSSTHPLIYLFATAKGDINARDKYLLTPLHYAVARNNFAGVKQLIELGADIEARDRQGVRPLHLACKEGYLMIATYLIERGVKIDAIDADKWTPLHYACAKGNLDIIKLLKSKDEINFQKFIQIKTIAGTTCLHLAVQHGNIQSVVYVLDQFQQDTLNILVNDKAESFGTPLHIAAKFCDPPMIDVLYNHGADPLIRNSLSQSALHIACAANRLSIVQKLLLLTQKNLLEMKDEHGQTALSLTTSTVIIDSLLASGADISSLDNNDMNALMIAASKNQLPILEHLLFYINYSLSNILEQATKRDHRTIFLLAAQTGCIEMCTLLLAQPYVRWDTVDKQHMNAFHVAAQNNHSQLIEFLAEKLKSDQLSSTATHNYSRSVSILTRMNSIQPLSSLYVYLNAQNDDGKTPLHIAAEHGYTSCVKALLKYEAAVLLPNYLGQLALHVATQNGHNQCVDLLIKASTRNLADFQSALLRKQSPLITACQNGFANIVQLLLSQNIGIDCGDIIDSNDDFNSNDTTADENPLEIAIKYRHIDTINVLLEHPHVEYWLSPVRKADDHLNQTPLRDMIRYIPECAKLVFDKFIVKTNGIDLNGNTFEKTTYQYKYIDDYFMNQDKLYAPNGRHLYRNHPFIIALDSEHHSLLEHPLAQQLMQRKWKLYRLRFYLTRLLTFLLLLVLTFYTLIVPAPNMKSSPSMHASFIHNIILPTKWTIVTLATMNLLLLIAEILRYRGLRVPFAQLFGIISYLTSIAAFQPYQNIDLMHIWQWQLAALSTLLQWFNVALILRSFPFIGDFMVMFQSILINFFMLIFVTLPLLVAFTLGKKMIFFNHSAFLSTLLSIHKLSAMLAGEFSFEMLFFSTPISIVSMLLFVSFMAIMTIVFMNLLLGVTIGDLQVCMENARAKANAYRIRELLYIEATLPSVKWLKSNIIEGETIDNFSKESVSKNDADNDTDNNNETIFNHQRLSELEKLLNTLNILCTQAKQVLEIEIDFERTLKQLLSARKTYDIEKSRSDS